jgi:hypothetical protein
MSTAAQGPERAARIAELKVHMDTVLADAVKDGISPWEIIPAWIANASATPVNVVKIADQKQAAAPPIKTAATDAKLLAELSAKDRAVLKSYRNNVKDLEKHDTAVKEDQASLRNRVVAFNALVRYTRKKATITKYTWYEKLVPVQPKIAFLALYNNAGLLIEEAKTASKTLSLSDNTGELMGDALKPAAVDSGVEIKLDTVLAL